MAADVDYHETSLYAVAVRRIEELEIQLTACEGHCEALERQNTELQASESRLYRQNTDLQARNTELVEKNRRFMLVLNETFS